jgi:cytochrome bd-type quinol oxidase subunit 2
MKQFVKKFGLTLASLALAVAVLMPVSVSAQLFDGAVDQACEGASAGTSCGTAGSGEKVNSTIATIINIFSVIVGVTAVIMIIIGGMRYVTSSGDSTNINNAKNTILYAIIGLVVVAFAQVIVRFVLNQI